MLRMIVAVLAAVALNGCMANAFTSGGVAVRSPNASVDVRFGDRDRVVINEYYSGYKAKKFKSTPPGLARKDKLPPGLARHNRLPPGLQGRSLPADLEGRLSPLPAPYGRVVIGADIVLINRNTRVVLDVMKEVVID